MTAQSALKESRLALVGPSEAVAEPATTHGREWWAASMNLSDEQYVSLIREIEAEKGARTGHERECAERYKRLDEKMDGFQTSLADVKDAFTTALSEVKAAVVKTDGRGAKWKDRVLYSAIAVLFAFGAWAGGQLWSAVPLHH